MTHAELTDLFAYNRWANARVRAAVRELPAPLYTRDLRGSFGSVRGTMLHLLWGECGWLEFWKRGEFIAEFSDADFESVAELDSLWGALEAQQCAFLATLDDAQLQAPRLVDEHSYSLGELMLHLLTHSTHHRGQVVLMLRQLERVPPQTDLRDFLTEVRTQAYGMVRPRTTAPGPAA